MSTRFTCHISPQPFTEHTGNMLHMSTCFTCHISP